MSETIQSVFINGRYWFDRTGGNSYHSAQIWINGAWVGNTGMSYGYGDSFRDTASAWLRMNGILPFGTSLENLEREGVAVYSVLVESRKRELFKPDIMAERVARFAMVNA